MGEIYTGKLDRYNVYQDHPALPMAIRTVDLVLGVGNLDDRRPGSNGFIVDGVLAARQDDIGLPVDTLWHHDGVPTTDGSSVDEDGPSNGDESTIHLSARIDRLEDEVRRVQRDGVSALDGAFGAEGQNGERLNGQCDIGRRARDDELSRERVDLVQGERGVEGRRERRLAERGTDVGAVARLDRKHGTGVGQVLFRHDVGGGAKVCADADAFEHRGQHHEGFRVRDAEVVGAFGNGLATSS